MSDGRATNRVPGEAYPRDVRCDGCGTDDWRETIWPAWAECSWCGHRQEVPPRPVRARVMCRRCEFLSAVWPEDDSACPRCDLGDDGHIWFRAYEQGRGPLIRTVIVDA